MELRGPEHYALTFGQNSFKVAFPKGHRTFRGDATSALPKLYVIRADGSPVYVGITLQTLQKRLRLGWSATGESGYHGYRWRRYLTEATLVVWYHTDAPRAAKLHERC